MSAKRIPVTIPRGLAVLTSDPPVPDEEQQCYELVKHNSRNPATTTVVGTVRGPARAQRAVEVLDGRLKPEEREAGFSHYLQETKTPIKPRRPIERRPIDKRRYQ